MQRRQVLFSALGLMLAASAAQAAVPNTVTILGKQYTVIASPRVGTFKNGVTVNLQSGGGGAISDADVAKKANLAFAPGADASTDRLFVVAATQDDPDATSDGFYMLKGTDANGAFTLKDSEATVFLKGNREVHGRMQNITFLNDTDTGVKKDRNLYIMTFTDQNRLRFYDLDSLSGTGDNVFRDLTVFTIKEPGDGCAATPPDTDPAMEDANAPNSDFEAGALAPNGMMIVAGADTDADGNATIALGVIDPVKGTQFLPVKTDLNKATGGNKITTTEQPVCFVRLTGDEYLMIATDPNTGGNATEGDLNSQTLYHFKITLPADLTKSAPDSIQAQLIDKQDLPSLNLGQSPTHKIQGVAVGREVSAGKPILYMADWAGNLFTLRPQ
jgi:hypothetical protein